MLTLLCRTTMALDARGRRVVRRHHGRRRANAQEDDLGADAPDHGRRRGSIPLRGAQAPRLLRGRRARRGHPKHPDRHDLRAGCCSPNNAQVGTTAAEAIMAVREQGGDLVSFFNLKRNAGTFLVVLPNSPIHSARRPQGQDHRRAVVRRRRWPGLEAEPEPAWHHARSVHRDQHRRRAFGGRGARTAARSMRW